MFVSNHPVSSPHGAPGGCQGVSALPQRMTQEQQKIKKAGPFLTMLRVLRLQGLRNQQRLRSVSVTQSSAIGGHYSHAFVTCSWPRTPPCLTASRVLAEELRRRFSNVLKVQHNAPATVTLVNSHASSGRWARAEGCEGSPEPEWSRLSGSAVSSCLAGEWQSSHQRANDCGSDTRRTTLEGLPFFFNRITNTFFR